ncbi:MAG: type I phosphomannose isomerase catalytic subunit [Planctomycetota bacterium]
MHPYPLIFEPILKEKVWGGRRLEMLGKSLPGNTMVGESWELADLGSTSADGGGGDAAHSVIANGEMRGLHIHQAIVAQGANLLGHLSLTERGGFPLLVKYLDARENLSVQVHPSPTYAETHPGAHLKTESWYVVHAEPGSKIYHGLKPGTDPASFAAHIAAGSVEGDLVAIDAVVGDVHHLPSGTCHALGAGVLVAEVQTPSDTTFRVHDWGREGRTLHVDQAMACIDFTSAREAQPIRSDGSPHSALVSTPHYALAEVRSEGDEQRSIETHEDKPVVWMVMQGGGRLESEDGGFEPVRFETGTTMLIPALLDGVRCVFERASTVLEVRFP